MPGRLELGQIREQMVEGRIESAAIYAAFARLGLRYGAGFQGIASVELGKGQALARVRLPEVVAGGAEEYDLHPSVLDGALQAALVLSEGGVDGLQQLRLPFALERVRIIAPCRREMAAWVRWAEEDKAGKLDVDLCDPEGNVCVEMRGLTTRVRSQEMRKAA